MAWIFLVLAGFFEVGFAICLKLSENFSKFWPSLGFVVLGIISFSLLNQAIKTIPIGTAYAVWTGLGAFGTAILGIFLFRESADFWRVFFLSTLILSVIGLKWVSAQ